MFVLSPVDACPNQITPYNGTKTYSSDTNRYFEDAEVTFTCDEGLIMVGASYKRCAYNADEGSLMWTGTTGDNACIGKSVWRIMIATSLRKEVRSFSG